MNRIEAIPDADGIIRLTAGGELFEIVVQPHRANPPPATPEPPPPRQNADPERDPMPDWDEPGIFKIDRRMLGGGISVIMASVRGVIADPNQANPHRIVLDGITTLDLNSLPMLRHGLDDALDSYSIVADFVGSRARQ